MTRKLLSLAAASAVAIGLLVTLGASGAGAAAGGGCQLAGTASFSPGLSNTAGNFNYGVYPAAPFPPYLTDLAVGVKTSDVTGALVVIIR